MLSPDGSTCPENENSTDCLLRVLLQAFGNQTTTEAGKFNWDPITFGFTVPIAFIAALFALIAVFQAVLSAGPGRRKSNRNAIGNWSEYTTRQWSWTEMTSLSIARTPILRRSRLLQLLEEQSRPKKRVLKKASSKNTGSYSGVAATWLLLLEEAGMLSLPYNKDEDMQLTQCDYLPGDLRATPAYAEVGCIIAMTAVVGVASIEFDPQSAYPIIIGDGFQFDFRQHPALGIVGAFSPGKGNTNMLQIDKRNQTRLALQHAHGELHGGFCGAGEKIVVNAIKETHPCDDFCTQHRSETCHKPKHQAPCQHDRLFSGHDQHRLAWLMTSAAPTDVPLIFPSGSTIASNVLTILALHSRFWRAPRAVRLNEAEPSILPSSRVTWRVAELNTAEMTDTPYLMEVLHSTKALKREGLYERARAADFGETELYEESVLVAYYDVFQACLRLLYSLEGFQSWFSTLSDWEKKPFRILVLLQLKQIDQCFHSLPRQDVLCETLALYASASTLLNAKKAISEGTFDFTIMSDESSAEVASTPPAPTEIIAQNLVMLQTLADFARQYLGNVVSDNPDTPPGIEVPDLTNGPPRSQLYCLTGRRVIFDRFGPETLAALFSNVMHVVNQCLNEDDRERHRDSERPTDEIPIKRMLIWRCLLMAVLFLTAPDNSKMLASGLWNHVIPII